MSSGTTPHRIAIVGVGKIATDQHMPAIAASPHFELGGTVTRQGRDNGFPSYRSLSEMIEADPAIRCVAICTPPQVRESYAHEAIAAGLDVLLEKPPAMTMGAFTGIKDHAAEKGVVLFATWHSRFAPKVEAARSLLASRGGLKAARITWREDAHHWHPGQVWLWEPGGLGVFDPAINALSIFTRLIDEPISVQKADFEVPANWHSPIAAQVQMVAGDAPVAVDLDFRQKGKQSWDIRLECRDGSAIDLTMGGSKLAIDGSPPETAPEAEYPGIYARFAELLATRKSDADGSPLQLVADAFMVARCTRVDDFHP